MKENYEWSEPEKSPKVAVDVIIAKEDNVILLERAIPPFKGKLVLPGGMVEYGETVEQAAEREALEETGIKIKVNHILGVYSSVKRDPRFHTISTVFVAEPIKGQIKSSFEGKVGWHDVLKLDLSQLGFDHGKILKDYLKWKKSNGTYWSTK